MTKTILDVRTPIPSSALDESLRRVAPLALRSRGHLALRLARLAAVLALAPAVLSSHAGVKHWQGDVNGNWGTAGNWLENSIPANGDELHFSSATRYTMTNNLTGLRLDRITLTSGSYLLRGQGVVLTNGLTSVPPPGSVANQLEVGLTLAGSQSLRCDNSDLYLAGQISLGPHTLTVTNAGSTEIFLGAWAGTGLVSGSGGIVKEGAGTLNFAGWSIANTYTGPTHVRNGTLILGRTSVPSIPGPGALTIGDGVGGAGSAIVRLEAFGGQLGAMPVVINADGLLDLAGLNNSINMTLTLDGGDIMLGTGTLILGADLSVMSAGSVINGPGGAVSLPATQNLAVANGVVFEIQAPISGDGGLTKRGGGLLRLNYPGSYLGTTTVAEGELEARASGALGSGKNGTTVAKGAGLILSAAVFTNESLALNGDGLEGVGAVHTGTSTGTTVWAGTVTLESNSSITPMSPSAVLDFSGSVLGAGRLTKQGAGTLVFSGSSDNTYSGDTVVVGGALELRKTGAARAVFYGTLRVGDGAGGSRSDVVRLRGSSDDQVRDTVPVVIAESGLLELDFADETIGDLAFNGGDAVLTYSTLILGGSVTASGSSMVTATNGGVNLPAMRTFTVGTGSVLDLAAPVIGAGGITKTGTGTLQLSGNNTYDGLTVVQQGILEPRHSHALGGSATGTVVSNGASLVFVSPLTITGEGLTLNGAGSPGYGALDSRANPGTNTWSGVVLLYGDCALNAYWPSSMLRLTGFLAGPGALRVSGGGIVYLNGSEPNIYEGTTTVESGQLRLCHYTAEGAIPRDLVISGTVRLDWSEQISSNATVTIQPSGTLDLNGYVDHLGGLAGSGQLRLSGGRGYAACNHSSGTFGGVISGSGEFHKNGNGTLTLAGNNTLTGATFVDQGTLLINGSQPQSAVTVAQGGTLGGKGAVGNLLVEGTLRPGTSPGALECGNLTLTSTARFVAELNGTIAGLNYDQVQTTGTVRLGNAALQIGLGFSSTVGNSFMLIDNGSGAPVIGTFAGLGDQATFLIGNRIYQIGYFAGAGRDVVLAHVPPPSLQITPANRTNVVVSWPGYYTGFMLEFRTNLAADLWSPVSPQPVLSGASFKATNQASGLRKFYRLSRP